MVALAQHTEALGYRRYWIAEHHNTTSLAELRHLDFNQPARCNTPSASAWAPAA